MNGLHHVRCSWWRHLPGSWWRRLLLSQRAEHNTDKGMTSRETSMSTSPSVCTAQMNWIPREAGERKNIEKRETQTTGKERNQEK